MQLVQLAFRHELHIEAIDDNKEKENKGDSILMFDGELVINYFFHIFILSSTILKGCRHFYYSFSML